LLSITWMTGHAAGDWLIVMRIFQGVGAAMLMANSSAILTDVFPHDQRGMALGVNQAAAFKLRETSERRPARIDWPGNITFALGLILVMVGITYGIEPYGRHVLGWTSPFVMASLFFGVLLLVVFGIIESKVEQPMFRLQLFKIRAFTAGIL